jgi:hypothetical protein
VIQPNRLTDPAERAARERVEVVFAALDRLSRDELWGLVISPRPEVDRDQLLASLESAAATRRRTELLDEARSGVRDALQARMASGYPAGVYGVTATSASRVEDRVEVALAIEDAVSVAVTEDLIRPENAAALADPGRTLLGLPPLSVDDAMAVPPATPAWEPSADDWREAARESIDPDGPPATLSATRYLNVTLLGAIALFGAPTALIVGAANDELLIGILAAIAIVLACWKLAPPRPAR